MLAVWDAIVTKHECCRYSRLVVSYSSSLCIRVGMGWEEGLAWEEGLRWEELGVRTTAERII